MYAGGCVGSYHSGGIGGVVTGPAQMPTQPPVKKNGTTPPNPTPLNNGAGQVSTVASTAPATIVVNLPADAKLTVDGAATQSQTARRRFVTPALPTGRTFNYTMQAEVVRDGKAVTQQQTVTVRGGTTTNVSFTFSKNAVASR